MTDVKAADGMIIFSLPPCRQVKYKREKAVRSSEQGDGLFGQLDIHHSRLGKWQGEVRLNFLSKQSRIFWFNIALERTTLSSPPHFGLACMAVCLQNSWLC